MIAVVSLPISDISKKGIETKTDNEANTEDKEKMCIRDSFRTRRSDCNSCSTRFNGC